MSQTMTRRGLGLVTAVVCASGCATNLSMLQTAKTLDQGHVRVTAGAGLYIPAGQAVTAIGTGVDVSKKLASGAVLSEQEEQQVLTSAVALAVLPPAPMVDVAARVGVVKNLEVGLGWKTSAVRGDVKYRFFHDGDEASERSTDVAIDVGASKYLFSGPVISLLDTVKLGDFSRWDADGAVIVSHDFNRYFSLYAAGRYSFSHTTMDETLVRVSQEGTELIRSDVTLPASVDMHFIGATGGLRAGLPQLSVMLELTGGYTVANARILGTTRALGGVTFYPAVGLTGAF